MARDDLVFIAVVLDRSGSMQSQREDAIGGFNSFLKEQQDAPGEALFTLALFNTQYTKVHDGVPVKDVPPLDRTTYVPMGGTALLDAVGNTVNDMEATIAKMPEDQRPARQIVAILSDGQENSSTEFKKHVIKDMIEERSKHGWDFMFLSAGLDQFADAHEIGVHSAMYATGQAGSAGIKGIVGATGARVASYRSARASGQCVSMSLNEYSEAEEKTCGGLSLQALVDQKTADLQKKDDEQA